MTGRGRLTQPAAAGRSWSTSDGQQMAAIGYRVRRGDGGDFDFAGIKFVSREAIGILGWRRAVVSMSSGAGSASACWISKSGSAPRFLGFRPEPLRGPPRPLPVEAVIEGPPLPFDYRLVSKAIQTGKKSPNEPTCGDSRTAWRVSDPPIPHPPSAGRGRSRRAGPTGPEPPQPPPPPAHARSRLWAGHSQPGSIRRFVAAARGTAWLEGRFSYPRAVRQSA
jgi:hypothetical protein